MFSKPEDNEAAEYRKSGTSGHAKATIAGKKSALVHFNDFLSTKRMKGFDELSDIELCSIPLWQEYGTYLSEHAKKKTKVSFVFLALILVRNYLFAF